MRIALVAEDYYPQMGGVPEHTHHLARQLRVWGHTADIFTSRMNGAHGDPPFVHRVGTSRVIRANGGVSRITTGWGLRRKLADRFREGRYDLVHIQNGLAPTFGVVGPLAARQVGIPVVATFHSWFPRSAGYRIFRRGFQWLLDRHAATIAVSEPVVWAMSRYLKANWEVIPNGVDTAFFQPIGRHPEDLATRAPRLLFLARLERRNDLETVLDAMPRVLERYPGTQLTVAGDGPQRRSYERRARSLSSSVRFVGEIHGERPHYYASADLYLCPTTRASFGVTLLESMACGTPMIVSDIVGFRELVNGGAEAVLVPGENPKAWAETTIALLADPDRRRLMGEAGRHKAQQFDWSLVGQRIVEVYERVLRQRARG